MMDNQDESIPVNSDDSFVELHEEIKNSPPPEENVNDYDNHDDIDDDNDDDFQDVELPSNYAPELKSVIDSLFSRQTLESHTSVDISCHEIYPKYSRMITRFNGAQSQHPDKYFYLPKNEDIEILKKTFRNLCQRGSIRELDYFLNHNRHFDPHFDNDTCFVTACTDNSCEIVKYLYNRIRPNIETNHDEAFRYTCLANRIETAYFLIEICPRYDFSIVLRNPNPNSCDVNICDVNPCDVNSSDDSATPGIKCFENFMIDPKSIVTDKFKVIREQQIAEDFSNFDIDSYNDDLDGYEDYSDDEASKDNSDNFRFK